MQQKAQLARRLNQERSARLEKEAAQKAAEKAAKKAQRGAKRPQKTTITAEQEA